MSVGTTEDIDDLEMRMMALEQRNKELVVELMKKSAQLSEAKEKLKRWQTELEILADQKGHDLCWVGVPKLLKNTLGHTGKYPDPENVTREEFGAGCVAYVEDLFGSKVVIPEKLKNKGILNKEQAEIVRKTLGFKE